MRKGASNKSCQRETRATKTNRTLRHSPSESARHTSEANWSNVHKTVDDVEWRTTRGDERPLCHLRRTPASWKQIQNAQEEEPRRSSHMTRPGVHGKGLVPIVCFSNTLRTMSKHTGRCQREERALQLLELLLAPQGKALLEDFNPCCWRVSCKLVAEYSSVIICRIVHAVCNDGAL